MRTFIYIPTLILFAVALSACHTGYDEGSDVPQLYSFDMLDSYGVNTEFDGPTPLVLSPFIDHGYFEINWDVSSYYAYRVELFVNDRNSPHGGILVSSDWCGTGEICGNRSVQSCYYNDDLSVSCDFPNTTIPQSSVDISPVIDHLPENVFFVLEICDEDLFYCEYQSRRVTLE